MNNYLPKVVEENVLKIDDFKIHYYAFNNGTYVFDVRDIELFFLQRGDTAQEYLLRAITTLLNAVEEENDERR